VIRVLRPDTLAAILCLCTGFASATELRLDRDAVVESYLSLTFGTEFETAASRSDVLVKRPQDQISVVVTFPQPSSFRYELFWQVGRIVAEMAAYSMGQQVRALGPDDAVKFLTNPSASNVGENNAIVVNIGSRNEIRASLELAASADPALLEIYESVLEQAVAEGGAICLVASGFPMAGSPVLGKAIIWIEDTPNLEDCLYEEMLQSFGLMNDIQRDVDSLFSDVSSASRPSSMDWCFWAIHTNAAMKAGMDQIAARAAAQALFPSVCDQ
jgi:hypothetical protein